MIGINDKLNYLMNVLMDYNVLDDVVAIVVYGSFIYEEKFNDIDLLVIVNDDCDEYDVIRKLWLYKLETDIPIDVTVQKLYIIRKLICEGNLFITNVLKTGTCIKGTSIIQKLKEEIRYSQVFKWIVINCKLIERYLLKSYVDTLLAKAFVQLTYNHAFLLGGYEAITTWRKALTYLKLFNPYITTYLGTILDELPRHISRDDISNAYIQRFKIAIRELLYQAYTLINMHTT